MDRLNEINQAAFGGKIEKAQRASGAESLLQGNAMPVPFIDQQNIRAKRFRQRDSGGFSFIEAGHLRKTCRVMDFKPRGRRSNPTPNLCRRERVGKLRLNRNRQGHPFEQAGK